MASPITGPGIDPAGRYSTESANRKTPSQGTVQGTTDAPQQPIRTAQDAINVLRARLEQRMQQSLGHLDGSAARALSAPFEPPSAAEVAANVLGFVQARLQQEADAGADTERLADLLAQARAGVEQGFREAREQIEALGMMNDELSADIDDSFNRIQDGLADLESRFLGRETIPAGVGMVERATLAQAEAATENTMAFEVRTRDGDVVTVTMNERSYAGIRGGSVQGRDGEVSGYTAVSMFAGRYEFAVEGELDEAERQALTELFEGVQNVSSRFFDGDIQGAFQAAQSLGIGGGELASFSLNLSSSRSIQASTYESVAQRSSPAGQLRPLGDLARSIQQLGQDALDNGIDLQSFDKLMSRMMDDIQQAAEGGELPVERSYMAEFFHQILERLQSQTT